MTDLEKLEERIGRIEQELFGFTFEEASKYLRQVNENMGRMGGVNLDSYCSRNLETIRKAEKCVGV